MRTVEAIAKEWQGRPGKVTGALRSLQQEMGYLDEEAVRRLAQALQLPLSQVYAVATFFSAFRLKPRGEVHIQVCMGTACHVRGSSRIMSKLERVLGIAAGETTKDRKYSLEAVRCLGCCGLAPVIVANDTAYGRVKQSRVEKFIAVGGSRHENSNKG